MANAKIAKIIPEIPEIIIMFFWDFRRNSISFLIISISVWRLCTVVSKFIAVASFFAFNNLSPAQTAASTVILCFNAHAETDLAAATMVAVMLIFKSPPDFSIIYNYFITDIFICKDVFGF